MKEILNLELALGNYFSSLIDNPFLYFDWIWIQLFFFMKILYGR